MSLNSNMVTAGATLRRAFLVAGFLAAGAFSPFGVAAQGDAPPSADGMSREQMMERIRERFEEQMANDLQLTPEQRQALGEVMLEFRQTRQELAPRRTQLARDMRAYYQNRGTEEEARRLVLEARALRERETEIMHQEEDRLLEVLQPSQVLLMQLLRDQFGGQIRSLDGRDGSGPFGNRGGGPPGR